MRKIISSVGCPGERVGESVHLLFLLQGLIKWKSITSTLNHLNWFRYGPKAQGLGRAAPREQTVSTAGGCANDGPGDHSYQHNYKLRSRLFFLSYETAHTATDQRCISMQIPARNLFTSGTPLLPSKHRGVGIPARAALLTHAAHRRTCARSCSNAPRTRMQDRARCTMEKRMRESEVRVREARGREARQRPQRCFAAIIRFPFAKDRPQTCPSSGEGRGVSHGTKL